MSFVILCLPLIVSMYLWAWQSNNGITLLLFHIVSYVSRYWYATIFHVYRLGIWRALTFCREFHQQKNIFKAEEFQRVLVTKTDKQQGLFCFSKSDEMLFYLFVAFLEILISITYLMLEKKQFLQDV